MVVPRQSSDLLRSVSGATSIEGISDFLSNLLEGKTTVASSIAESGNLSQVSSMIQTYIVTISTTLSNILTQVSSIHTIVEGTSRRTATEPEPINPLIQKYEAIPLPY